MILPCVWLVYASVLFVSSSSVAHSVAPGLLPALLFSLAFWFVRALSTHRDEHVFWIANCLIISAVIVLTLVTFNSTLNAWRNGYQTVKHGYRTDLGQSSYVFDGMLFVVCNVVGFKV
jgi:hypothetical protein